MNFHIRNNYLANERMDQNLTVNAFQELLFAVFVHDYGFGIIALPLKGISTHSFYGNVYEKFCHSHIWKGVLHAKNGLVVCLRL